MIVGNSPFTDAEYSCPTKICGGSYTQETIGIHYPDIDDRGVSRLLHAVVFRIRNQHTVQWQEGRG